MPRYSGYLSKAHRLNGWLLGTQAPIEPGLRVPQAPCLPQLPSEEEWTQLVARLWDQRSNDQELSIGVFPCSAGEDHGWFAAGLALFARQTLDRETLLIDLDSSGAPLAGIMRTPSRPGLAEFLNSAPEPPRGCVHETGWNGVYVLPHGAAAANFDPRETEPRMRSLHSAVLRDFPVVIMRFPRLNRRRAANRWRSCYGVPEMGVLAVARRISRKSELRRDTKLLRKSGANLVGLVFTGSDPADESNFFLGAIR